MKPTITAFEKSPDRGRGLARDMRVRWACEEVGQPYDVRLLSFTDMKKPDHRSRNPFGQIPAYQSGDFKLFESGAIVLQIAETHAGLLPKNPDDRMHAIMWMFAALNTIELPVVELSMAMVFEREKKWYADRLPMLEERVSVRFAELSHHLEGKIWLDGEFSAGDLMMISVIRRLNGSELIKKFPTLTGYIARGEARPAYLRAFAAQKAVFEASLNPS